jgi:hypothetical protein
MKRLFLLTLIVSFVSCVTTNYSIKSDSKIETLSLCVKYADIVPDSIKTTFDRTITSFIINYNQEPHEFKLSMCNDSTNSALMINVTGTILVSNGRQVFSTIFTMVGFSLPFIMIAANSPIIITFWMFPKDVSVLKLKLTEDITSIDSSYNKIVLNSGYLRSQRKQIKKHGIAFNDFLRSEIRRIEKQYKKRHLP